MRWPQRWIPMANANPTCLIPVAVRIRRIVDCGHDAYGGLSVGAGAVDDYPQCLGHDHQIAEH